MSSIDNHSFMNESFENWYSDVYEWEIKRGSRGQTGKHLTKYDGDYISNHARDNFKVWCAAMSRVTQNDIERVS